MRGNDKLTQVDEITYQTPDGEYTLEKRRKFVNGRSKYVWRLYRNGSYVGQPESIAQANQWIKQHREQSSLREGAYAPKSRKYTFQLSFDFVHEGYWGKDDIERIVDIALDASDCDLVTIDFSSVDSAEYPEYDEYVVTRCDVEFECLREGYSAGMIKETLEQELEASDYALAGIEFI